MYQIYPFGMEMPGRSLNSEESRFGFNGYEKDNEIKGTGNSLDFTARMYDSRIGRFLSIDPYYTKFPSESHYGFAGNNPIYYMDKDGGFKLHPDIAKNYPAVHKYLSTQIELDVMTSTYIKKAYKYLFGNISDAEIRSAFKDNSGPELFPDQFPGGQDAAGHYYDPERALAVNMEVFKYANDALENKMEDSL